MLLETDCDLDTHPEREKSRTLSSAELVPQLGMHCPALPHRRLPVCSPWPGFLSSTGAMPLPSFPTCP